MSLTTDRLLYWVTDLGDAALLLPASGLLLVYFLYLGWRRGAVAWATTVALCVALTIVSKLGVKACGDWLALLDIRSPSGHTSLGTTFYACCAVSLSRNKSARIRLLLLASSALLILSIAVSRVLIEAHSAQEVVVGLAIGACCVWWFGRRTLERPAPVMPWEPMALSFVALALALHGLHLTLEGPIARLAHLLGSTAECA